MKWAVFENEHDVHICPVEMDWPKSFWPHAPFADCWCEPVKDGQLPLFIHNEEA